eukprot:CAMPEP_0203842770 /NCGR_PEP_ID=MMETSP0359-20131031/2193_1 /ASSEMBLY_ACC=CAM_ASM_000338 /TAXON_ID=268821 /ORGANISM="Scrippsiella Hangoei, Strain SHTV-5" /LENGTH=34 /DNA_ID= /DNA_START= /DNA_END= /DNA_ORIENTATION=
MAMGNFCATYACMDVRKGRSQLVTYSHSTGAALS